MFMILASIDLQKRVGLQDNINNNFQKNSFKNGPIKHGIRHLLQKKILPQW
jgi:hypothetical protein